MKNHQVFLVVRNSYASAQIFKFLQSLLPFQVLLSVDAINSYIAWDFSVIQGKIAVVLFLNLYWCFNLIMTFPSILLVYKV